LKEAGAASDGDNPVIRLVNVVRTVHPKRHHHELDGMAHRLRKMNCRRPPGRKINVDYPGFR
jgi:hypothetical protein